MLATRSMLASRPMLATRSLATIRRLGTDDPRMSQIVVHNGIVHTCGQTDAVGKTAEEQTRACLAKVDALLARAGTDKSQLLTASIWLKHIEQDFAEMNGVWNAWLDPANKPVRFCVEVCRCQAHPPLPLRTHISQTHAAGEFGEATPTRRGAGYGSSC